MKPRFILATLLAGLLLAADPSPGFAAEAAVEPAAKFSETQREYVHSWIRQAVPTCPRELADLAVDQFLDELKRRAPADLDRLLTPGFPANKHKSNLLRLVGAQLTGPANAALREEVSRLRIQALLEWDAGSGGATVAEATARLNRIKAMAPIHPRRLFEGRMDDDELGLLLKKSRDPQTPGPTVALPPKPKVLTANDIVAEYGRRNQEGAAAQKLRALTLELQIKTPKGEEQQIFLYRLRPDRFRMTVRAGGITRAITAFDGTKYWQAIPGRTAREIPAKVIGELRHLREFSDPLFAESGYTFERLADGKTGESAVYRISVRRADGSCYVAQIDQENFRQVGREIEEKQTIRYSDFRTVAGLTLAFREDLAGADGSKTVLTLARATPDPALIQAFFEMPTRSATDYFALEAMMQTPAVATAK